MICTKYLLLLLHLATGARKLRGNQPRIEGLLPGDFPFEEDSVEDYSDTDKLSEDLSVRLGRQNIKGGSTTDTDEDEKRCIDKVEMVEETEYDNVVKCDHSYDKRCHTTYVTNFVSQQEEECDDNFRKNCYIEYEQIAFNESVEVCRTPLVKDCDIQGPEVCRTEYESECWTRQEVHEVEDDVVTCNTEKEEKCGNSTEGYTTSTKCRKVPREVCTTEKKLVKKYNPVTACTKEPREMCAPAGCGLKEGFEECFDKTKTIVQDAPKEKCSLEPQRTCKHVTKLVPKLEPKEECTDIPKEVCTRSKTNPRKVKKPVVIKWCYNPVQQPGGAKLLDNLRAALGQNTVV